jgi:hypothetical protein
MPVTLHLGGCLVSNQPAAADGVVLAVCVPEWTKSCVALKDTTYPKLQSRIVQPRAEGGADDSRAHAELCKLSRFVWTSS